MNILKVDNGMQEVSITYNEQLAKGIYKVFESSKVRENCEVLRITIDKPKNANESAEKVSKLGEVGILTIRVTNEYVQFIFTSDVNADDFERLLTTVPPNGRDAFVSAYNATKRITLDDFDSFAKMFSNIKGAN